MFGYYPPEGQNCKFFIENFAFPGRRFSGNCMSKRPAGQGLAKSLAVCYVEPCCYSVCARDVHPESLIFIKHSDLHFVKIQSYCLILPDIASRNTHIYDVYVCNISVAI